MTDLPALRALIERAELQRDQALAEQVKLEAARRAAERQADELLAYRREYEQRWGSEFSRVGQMELVRCYQGFVERLNQAVQQQQRIARDAGGQVERAAALVRGHDARATALRKLLERRLEQSWREQGRAEQKQSDELAARMAAARLGGLPAFGAA